MEPQFRFELRKEREFGEKVNGTFTFLSQNFRTLLKCFIYIPLPFAILAGIAMGIYQSDIFGTLRDMNSNGSGAFDSSRPFAVFDKIFSPSYFIAIICTAIASILVYTTTFAYMKVYLNEEIKDITFEKVWTIVKEKIVSLIFYDFAILIIIIIATLFIIFPGIYLAIIFSMFTPVFIFEDKGFGQTMSRCFYLIRDKWWSTFGLLFIMYLIITLANIVFQVPQFVVTILTTMKLYNNNFPALNILTGIIGTVGGLMLNSIIAIALGMQYFNLVERNEGLGLRAMIDQIGNVQPLQQDKNIGEL